MKKTDFIIAFNNIVNGIKIEESKFNSIVDTLKVQGLLEDNFVIDLERPQQENILMGIYNKSLVFYEIYLGQ